MKRQLLFGHVLSLLAGGLVYLLFRTSTLKMFGWFDKLGLTETIKSARSITLDFSAQLPNWFKFSLPDGLWIFSYVTLILYVWQNKITKGNVIWIVIAPLLIILFEIGQLFKITPGTFDLVDLAFYLCGASLPILVFSDLCTSKFTER